MFNLAIDSKLRGCDVVALKVEDVAPNGYAVDRATVRQRKTGQPVRFELTEQTCQAIDDYVRVCGKKPGVPVHWPTWSSPVPHDEAVRSARLRLGRRHRVGPSSLRYTLAPTNQGEPNLSTCRFYLATPRSKAPS